MFPTAMGDVSHHFWTKNGTFCRGSLEKLLLATSFRISTWGKVEKCSQSPVVQRFFGILGIGMMGNYFRYKGSCIDHVDHGFLSPQTISYVKSRCKSQHVDPPWRVIPRPSQLVPVKNAPLPQNVRTC